MSACINKRTAGFTMIELLVVMLILSFLIGVGIISTRHLRNRAMLALFFEDMRRTKEAANHFAQDCGFMPPDVWRGVDPSFVEIDGYKKGNHSAVWQQVEKDLQKCWAGPYLREWKNNPWGGLYDWDNYPSDYSAWGIPGGGCYLTLKPATWGGQDGLPALEFEDILEAQGVDKSTEDNVVSVWMGKAPDFGVQGK
ncbi:MAG: prepilin-type N-terminal cleavage/methylation domain-containing protein [Candidatus Lernaella stagnicola]|nr:prepilin-type N-terminal cleavage/methylation domain-containing protein [Candidatus Lernaella stagnicola]